MTSRRPCWWSRSFTFLSSGNLTPFSRRFYFKNVYGTNHQHVLLVTCLQTKAIETPTYWKSRHKGGVYPWTLITWIPSITRGRLPRKSRWTSWYWQWRANRKGWSRCCSCSGDFALLIILFNFIKKDQHKWLSGSCAFRKRLTSQLSSSVFDLFFISTFNNLNSFYVSMYLVAVPHFEFW